MATLLGCLYAHLSRQLYEALMAVGEQYEQSATCVANSRNRKAEVRKMQTESAADCGDIQRPLTSFREPLVVASLESAVLYRLPRRIERKELVCHSRKELFRLLNALLVHLSVRLFVYVRLLVLAVAVGADCNWVHDRLLLLQLGSHGGCGC